MFIVKHYLLEHEGSKCKRYVFNKRQELTLTNLIYTQIVLKPVTVNNAANFQLEIGYVHQM